MIKHIIFDCFGTLIDTENNSKAVKQILLNVGAPIDAKDFYKHWKAKKRERGGKMSC